MSFVKEIADEEGKVKGKLGKMKVKEKVGRGEWKKIREWRED